jgi:hypothetical protein
MVAVLLKNQTAITIKNLSWQNIGRHTRVFRIYLHSAKQNSLPIVRIKDPEYLSSV